MPPCRMGRASALFQSTQLDDGMHGTDAMHMDLFVELFESWLSNTKFQQVLVTALEYPPCSPQDDGADHYIISGGLEQLCQEGMLLMLLVQFLLVSGF